jgi:hypothetical protein
MQEIPAEILAVPIAHECRKLLSKFEADFLQENPPKILQ